MPPEPPTCQLRCSSDCWHSPLHPPPLQRHGPSPAVHFTLSCPWASCIFKSWEWFSNGLVRPTRPEPFGVERLSVTSTLTDDPAGWAGLHQVPQAVKLADMAQLSSCSRTVSSPVHAGPRCAPSGPFLPAGAVHPSFQETVLRLTLEYPSRTISVSNGVSPALTVRQVLSKRWT